MDSLNVDNDALKAKIRSCNTLNTFYHETRQEIDTLSKQILQKDNVIADLKARLAKYERIDIHVDGYEPVVIGPSKSLLESLCKEIYKVKQKCFETQVNASRQAELNQQEIQKLKQQLREKERELEAVTQRPEHEKDQEIQRLQSVLEEKERVQATRAVLCNSLVEEGDQLRAQLAATVRVCQELLGKIEKEKKGGVMKDELKKEGAKEMTESSEELVSKLQEQNRQLRQRVNYVEGLNAKWQRYDSSREEYVRGLCQRLNESNALAPTSPSPVEGPRPRPRQGPGAGLGLMTTSGLPSPGLLQTEIARLNGLLEEKMRDCGRLGRELEDIKRADQERIQMLEQQVLIYKEDFMSERADRERAQGKIQDLKDEASRLQQQLHPQGRGQEVVATCRVHTGRRGSPRHQTNPVTQRLRSSAAFPVATAELECPRCLAKFDDAQAKEYLSHCEECARL